MRLDAVDCRELRWPIVPRGSARTSGTERACVIVAVRGRSVMTGMTGTTGLGEAAPLPGFSMDSLADARRAATDLTSCLPLELPTPGHASTIAARITPAPAARFAIEAALLSAYAQNTRTSVARLLSPMPHAELRSATVVDDPAEAEAAFALGARCLKIKVGGDPCADIDRVHAIATRTPGALLRLDANRGWPADDIDRILLELRGLPIDYIEEPCPDAHLLLACDLPYRLALDESLSELDPAQLARAIASPKLAALVLKPTLLGGLARCMELAQLAHRHGVAPIVSHTLEGPVGTAACHELARAIGADVPVGLAPHPALDRFAEAR